MVVGQLKSLIDSSVHHLCGLYIPFIHLSVECNANQEQRAA